MSNHNLREGSFRHKRQGFTATNNAVVRDRTLSCRAKGLYTVIQSWITYSDIVLTKSYIRSYIPEGDKAFDAMWNELREHGYLKIYAFRDELGRYCYEYELLDEPDLRDGVYFYRYDQNGELVSTNLGPLTENNGDNASLSAAVPEKESKKLHPPKKDPLEKSTVHPPQNHPHGDHRDGDHPVGKGGDYIILNNKTNSNTISNPPIILTDEEKEEVVNELERTKSIPYSYGAHPEKMETAIHYLTGYVFRKEHPYSNEAQQTAFLLLVDCLVEMATAKDSQTYNGSIVTYAKLLEALNLAVDEWDDDGMEYFIVETLSSYLKATAETPIRNIRKYMKAVIWTSLSSFRANADARMSHLLSQPRKQTD